jgi:hypothetical protein
VTSIKSVPARRHDPDMANYVYKGSKSKNAKSAAGSALTQRPKGGDACKSPRK